MLQCCTTGLYNARLELGSFYPSLIPDTVPGTRYFNRYDYFHSLYNNRCTVNFFDFTRRYGANAIPWIKNQKYPFVMLR